MTLSFETAEEIRNEWFRIEASAKVVRAARAEGFPSGAFSAYEGHVSLHVDVEPEWLAGYVQALKSFLERLFTDAFGEDGKAILDGTHELAELKEQLLEEHGIAWLPPRVAELDEIVSEARAVLKAAPIVPVGDDHYLAAELRAILEEERQGRRFRSMYYERCELGGECRQCREFTVWRELVERLRRNLDRQDPEGAERRQQARRAATQRDYDAELEYLENR